MPSTEKHLEQKVSELQDKVLALSQEKMAAERELNEMKAQASELTRKLAEREARIAELEAREVEMELNSMLDRAIEEGRIVPAQRETLMALGKRDINALKEFIEKSPPKFSALSKDYSGNDQRPHYQDAEYGMLASRGVQVDNRRLELHRRAKLLSQEAGIPYAAAVNAIMREV